MAYISQKVINKEKLLLILYKILDYLKIWTFSFNGAFLSSDLFVVKVLLIFH